MKEVKVLEDTVDDVLKLPIPRRVIMEPTKWSILAFVASTSEPMGLILQVLLLLKLLIQKLWKREFEWDEKLHQRRRKMERIISRNSAEVQEVVGASTKAYVAMIYVRKKFTIALIVKIAWN